MQLPLHRRRAHSEVKQALEILHEMAQAGSKALQATRKSRRNMSILTGGS